MPKVIHSIVVSLFSLAVSAIPAARADWINLTGAETAPNIAEITILDDRVRVALEIYIGDLATFEALVPDDSLERDVGSRPPLNQRLQQFSAETFQIITDDGTTLQADLKLVEPRMRKDRYSPFAGMINPTTRQRVPEAPKDKRILYAELEYPFEIQPETLTFIPPKDENGVAMVSIGFIAYHLTVPIIDFRYLSGPATVMLDWSDPWYTKFDNPNLKRHHKSALMLFLYVEPREVRHEVLIRVRDLQEWTDLGLDGGESISPEEQAELKDRACAFLARHNPLTVDETLTAPASCRAAFLNISLRGLQVIEEKKGLDHRTAILGIILSYPVAHLPKNVSVRWDLFNERMQRIPATAIDPAGPFLSFVEAGDPILEWQNLLLKYQEPKVTPVMLDDGRPIRLPVLSVMLLFLALGSAVLAVRPAFLSRRFWIGAFAVSAVAAVLLLRVAVFDVTNPFTAGRDEKASAQIVADVLNNVNHAFIEKDPAALRQALEVIVASNALSDVEAELGRALAIKVAGGGIARVNAIEDLVVTNLTPLEDRSGFRSLAEWTAKVSAGHWGHIHRRKIRFRALVELVEEKSTWKLAGITVVDAKQ
jgi:hypothetical protein